MKQKEVEIQVREARINQLQDMIMKSRDENERALWSDEMMTLRKEIRHIQLGQKDPIVTTVSDAPALADHDKPPIKARDVVAPQDVVTVVQI